MPWRRRMSLPTAVFTTCCARPASRACAVSVFRGWRRFPGWAGKPGYEDWHLLDGSANLDVLNDAAISEARRQPHDRIAALAGEGTAGSMGLRMGTSVIAGGRVLAVETGWHGLRGIRGVHGAARRRGCALWGRRMTLGPTPEFCLHAPAARALPYPAQAISLHHVSNWPGSSP